MNEARFIPTYVGHTTRLSHREISGSVHPHLRGAYQFPRPVPVPHIGSSPHTWGIHAAGRVGSRPARFIPTYVGHTGLGELSPGPAAVHPHIRGAYYRAGSPPILRRTVHPHIRGAYAMQVIAGFGSVRFIPTYVGHTFTGCFADVRRQRFIPTYVGHTAAQGELLPR